MCPVFSQFLPPKPPPSTTAAAVRSAAETPATTTAVAALAAFTVREREGKNLSGVFVTAGAAYPILRAHKGRGKGHHLDLSGRGAAAAAVTELVVSLKLRK